MTNSEFVLPLARMRANAERPATEGPYRSTRHPLGAVHPSLSWSEVTDHPGSEQVLTWTRLPFAF